MSRGINEQNKHLTVEERYDAGRKHGREDAQIDDPEKRYINQVGKGLLDHTDAFLCGYFDEFSKQKEKWLYLIFKRC